MTHNSQAHQQLVCIGTVQGPINGEIARSYLEDAGIPAMLQQNTLGTIYGLTSGNFGQVSIFVPANRAQEAKELFDELEFD